MGLVKGRDQPVRDFLCDLPQAAQAGICMTSDPRGISLPVINKRLAFLLVPTSGTAFQLWEVDLETRAKRRLADPPAAAAGAYNTAIMAACYVPNGTATEDAPCVYTIVSLTAAPWNQLMVYNVATNVWAVLLAIPGMAAPLNTSIAMCNTSSALGVFDNLLAAIRNRFIYISGDNTGGGGVGNLGGVGGTFSNVDQYNIVTNVHVLLTGAGAARAAAAGAGSKLVWLPNFPDRLYSNRGGASAVLDYYVIGGAVLDSWVATNPIPAVVMGEGTELATLFEAPGWIAVRPGGDVNQILAVAVDGLYLIPVCQIDDAILPAAHASNALIAWWIAGDYYLGVVPYGRSVVKRILLPMPL